MKYTYYIRWKIISYNEVETAIRKEMDEYPEACYSYICSNYRYENEYILTDNSKNDANMVVKELYEKLYKRRAVYGVDKILYQIVGVHQNLFDFNEFISNDMYMIYKLLSRLLELYWGEDLGELRRVRLSLRDYLSDWRLKSFYLYAHAENLRKVNGIQYILYSSTIIDQIVSILGKEALDKLKKIRYGEFVDKQHVMAYDTLRKAEQYAINHVVNSISNFDSRMPKLIINNSITDLKMHINLLLADNGYKLPAKSFSFVPAKYIDKEEVLEKLCPFIHRRRVEDILQDVDKSLGLTLNNMDKLEQTSVFLLLYKRCNLFNKMVFSKFKFLLTQYYGISDNSYKENDCTNNRRPKCVGDCECAVVKCLCTGKCAEIYCNNRSLFGNKLKKNY